MSAKTHDNIQKMTVALVIALFWMLCCGGYAQAASVGTAQVRSAALDAKTITRNGMVRVYLSSLGNPGQLDITIRGNYRLTPGDVDLNSGDKLVVSFSSSTGALTVRHDGKTYQMGKKLSILRRNQDDSNGLLIAQSRDSSNPYPGDLSLEAVSGGSGYTLYPIVHVYIEKYLYGVLPYEMGNSSGLEALKAQAVAARTYTVRMMQNRSSGRYDVKDTTSDQVYRGTPSGNANCVRAVDETKGIVLMYGSNYITTYYSASNGGQTEIARSGTTYPYMKVKDDPFDYDNPNSAVKKKTIYTDLSKTANPSGLINLLKSKAVSALQDMGYPASSDNTALKTLKDVSLHSPMYASPSRLYTKIDFTFTVSTKNRAGETETVTLTQTCSIFSEIESLLGLSHQSASNELWSVVKTDDGFSLQSRRYGHGMGMSQRGAMYMAKLGYTYDEILGFYYEGCRRVGHSFTQTILSGESGDAEITVDTPADGEEGQLPAMEAGAFQAVVATQSGSLNLRRQPDVGSGVLTTIPQGTVIEVSAKGSTWSATQYRGQSGYVMTKFLRFIDDDEAQTPSQPEQGEGLKARVTTPSGSLNLRLAPNTGSRILARIPQATILNVSERGADWSLVSYNAQNGYVMNKFLTFETDAGDAPSQGEEEEPSTGEEEEKPSTGGEEEAPEEQPSVGESKTAYVSTESGPLNMRSQPSLSGRWITSIPRLAEVEVTSYGDEWCAVRYRGYTGFAMTRYLRFDDQPTQQPDSEESAGESGTPMWVVTQSGPLNLRSATNLSASVITTIPRYAQVTAYERVGEWRHVTYQEHRGFVKSAFLSESKPASASEPAQPQEPSAPSTEDSSGYITTGGITLDITLALPDSPAKAVTREDLTLYAMCVPDEDDVASVPADTEVEVLLVGELWCRVAYQDQQGYCLTNQLDVRYE